MNTIFATRLPAPWRAFVLAAAVACTTCSKTPTPQAPVAGVARAAIEPWSLPALSGSAQPDLITAPDGRLLLSWINVQSGRRPAFQFAEQYPDGNWQGPKTIVVGNSMFVNWADTPHIATTPDKAIWVHWLQKSADAPYAYDVMLTRSLDHGMNWSAPIKAHDDATTTEHGFVSFWPQNATALGMAWLDGRNTGGEAHAGHGGKHEDGHGGGMMSLRAAVFDSMLQSNIASEIDASTCDCCQTDAAKIAKGALLVYRDRTADEIRDIYATRFDGNAWSKPVRVHADNWKMPACPVNGPSVAARGDNAIVAWYTGAGEMPAIKLARSVDAGASFHKALVLDQGAPVLGRVDVALDDQQAWILWLREENNAQSLWLARFTADLSKELQRVKLADVQGKGRGTGFPKIALRGDAAYVVWTDIVEGTPRLMGVRVAKLGTPADR